MWIFHSRKLNSQTNKLHERIIGISKFLKIAKFRIAYLDLLSFLRNIIPKVYTAKSFDY